MPFVKNVNEHEEEKEASKICSCCGQELPLSKFKSWTNVDGTKSYLYQCLKCQRDKANKQYYIKRKFGKAASYDDEVLIKVLESRGYIITKKQTE